MGLQIASALGKSAEAELSERVTRINSPDEKDLEPGEVPRQPRRATASPPRRSPAPRSSRSRSPRQSKSPLRGSDPRTLFLSLSQSLGFIIRGSAGTWQHPMSRTQRLIAESARIRGLVIPSNDPVAVERALARERRRPSPSPPPPAFPVVLKARPLPPRPNLHTAPAPRRKPKPDDRRTEDRHLSGANCEPLPASASKQRSDQHRGRGRRAGASREEGRGGGKEEREEAEEGGPRPALRSTVVVTAQLDSGLKSVAIVPPTATRDPPPAVSTPPPDAKPKLSPPQDRKKVDKKKRKEEKKNKGKDGKAKKKGKREKKERKRVLKEEADGDSNASSGIEIDAAISRRIITVEQDDGEEEETPPVPATSRHVHTVPPFDRSNAYPEILFICRLKWRRKSSLLLEMTRSSARVRGDAAFYLPPFVIVDTLHFSAQRRETSLLASRSD